MSRPMALVRSPRFWNVLVVVWFSALFVVSSISKLPPGPKIENFDKIEHTVFYALGAACFYLGRRFGGKRTSALRVVFFTVIFCMAVGAFDEFHQSFVPNRNGNDPYDWMADTLGGFVGSLLGWMAFRTLASGSASRHP